MRARRRRKRTNAHGPDKYDFESLPWLSDVHQRKPSKTRVLFCFARYTCQLEGPSLPFVSAGILGRHRRPDKALRTERNGGGGGSQSPTYLVPEFKYTFRPRLRQHKVRTPSITTSSAASMRAARLDELQIFLYSTTRDFTIGSTCFKL